MFEPQQHQGAADGVTPAQPPVSPHEGKQGYAAPMIFPIGTSGELLQGSGRHKNDDTGRRGFEVG